MRLITNSQDTNGRFRNVLINEAKNDAICIASAFFTDWETLEKIIHQNCSVSLIVRLGKGTSVKALEKAFAHKNVDIRFFNDEHFHPKFYIIGQRIAFLGSANFTNNGLYRNQEVVIEITEKETISDLHQIFDNYWQQAKPLTNKDLELFKAFMKDKIPEERTDFNFAKMLANMMGSYFFNNAGIEEKKMTPLEKSIIRFQKEYQDFLSSYGHLTDIFEEFGQRRWHSIPLRIEIDRFVWWVGETYGADEKYRPSTGLSRIQVASRVKSFIPEFIASNDKWLDHDAVPRYQQVASAFSSKEKLETMSNEDIADILGYGVFSFSSYRYIKEGLENRKKAFIDRNPEGKIKKTCTYLFFGQEDYPVRLARCIHDPEYMLKTVGESTITELFGLANHENIPIRNDRVKKTLPWLGV